MMCTVHNINFYFVWTFDTFISLMYNNSFVFSFFLLVSSIIEVAKKTKKSQKKSGNAIKCVVVGDEKVGKTNLILSYLQHRFTTEHVPTASDIYNCK